MQRSVFYRNDLPAPRASGLLLIQHDQRPLGLRSSIAQGGNLEPAMDVIEEFIAMCCSSIDRHASTEARPSSLGDALAFAKSNDGCS